MQLQNQTPGQTIKFSQGDLTIIDLLAVDNSGNPVNLTGAILSTQILGPNGEGPVTFPNSQHTLGNQTTNPGTFMLTLQPNDTGSCGEGTNKQIITQSSVPENPTYFQGFNLLTVYANIPFQ